MADVGVLIGVGGSPPRSVKLERDDELADVGRFPGLASPKQP